MLLGLNSRAHGCLCKRISSQQNPLPDMILNLAIRYKQLQGSGSPMKAAMLMRGGLKVAVLAPLLRMQNKTLCTRALDALPTY